MFDKLFQFIRVGVRDAILCGIKDAHEELTERIERPKLVEADHPDAVEADTVGNGRGRKRAAEK